MRIAQIAPLYERVPPLLYGGTERVVANLTEELMSRGHDVTLFASADSITSARLEPMVACGTRLGGARDPLALHIAMLDEIYSRADEFDVIHSHVDVLAFPFARSVRTPTLSTAHGRLDFPEHQRVLSRFRDLPMVSISHAQRQPVRQLPLNWIDTVYNGVQPENFRFATRPQEPPYLAFVGRISPEKGPERAVEIARRAGIPLKIGAKIDPADEEWARQHFLPLLANDFIEFLGEVDEATKVELLAGASALLFPINWPEPFGMVLVEAMACGTPVIAFPGGAVEEIVIHGHNGFVCSNVGEAAEAISYLHEIDREICRMDAESRFSSSAMADGYEAVYRRLVDERLPVVRDTSLQPLTDPVVDREILVSDGAHLPDDGLALVPD